MSIAGGVGAAVRLPTPDARYGVEVSAARSSGRQSFRNGLRRSTALTDVATVTRATTAWGVDQGGNVAAVAVGQPVVNTAGLAVYEARTNYVRNPTGLGAVAGTPGTYPTSAGLTWNVANPGGEMQWQIASVGSEYGFNYYDLRIYGTPSVSNQAALPKPDVTPAAASVGQTWTYQAGARLISGAGPAQARAIIRESTGENTAPTVTLDNRFRVYAASRTFTNAAVASAEGYLRLDLTSGVAYDFVVRIYWQNLKLGADIGDPPILQTTNAAATRNADVISEAVNIPVGQAFTVTGKVIAAASLANSVVLADLGPASGSADELQIWANSASGGKLYVYAQSAGVGGASSTGVSIAPGAPVGFAVSVSGGVVSLSVNGSAPVVLNMAGGTFAQALTKLTLGCSLAGGAQLNSTLRDLNIVMRAYGDAELQAASDVTLTHDIDFVSQVYRYIGAPYVTPTDLPGTTFSRSTAAYGDDTAGNLILFPSGVPRITNKGVLIGEARTNVLLQSTTLANFSALNATNTTDGTLSLTGNLARKVTSLTAAATSFNYNIGSGASAGANTVSVYARRGSGSTDANTFALRNATTATTLVAIAVNYDTGVFSYSVGSSGAVVTPMANGWWRISLTSASFSAGDNLQFYAAFQGNAEAAGEYAYLADAQGEGGSFPASYTPTTSASATCNADVLASANDPNPTAYTVVAEFTVPATGPTTGLVWQWDDGTANNKSLLYYNRSTGRLYCQVYAGGVIQANLNLGAVTAGNSYNVALRVAANDFAASLGGAAVVTDTSGTVPTTSVFRFGADIPGAGGMWSGYIKRIRRYSVGKTNSELQALAA